MRRYALALALGLSLAGCGSAVSPVDPDSLPTAEPAPPVTADPHEAWGR